MQPPSKTTFHPVLLIDAPYLVLDLTSEEAEEYGAKDARYTLGRYDEHRPGLYQTDLFSDGRTVHVGIDLGAPAGTPVHAYTDGVVLHAGTNPDPGDYGTVLVLEHAVEDGPRFALYGHLSRATLALSRPGRRVRKGDVIGWLGLHPENGGWEPHLHFQLGIDRPDTHDMPGVVRLSERDDALRRYPDPRRVLGPLY